MRVFTTIDEMAAAAGQELGVSDWFMLEQSRIAAFADATEDHNWIHVDAERAQRELPARTTIAHGFLTLSLIPHLAGMVRHCENTSRAVNYGLNKVRFMNVVPSNARIRLRCKLLAAEKRAGGTQFTEECIVDVEGADRPACAAEMMFILYP